MPKLLNNQTQQPENLSHDQVTRAIASGEYSFIPGLKVPLLTPTGTMHLVDPGKAKDLIDSGYHFPDKKAILDYNAKQGQLQQQEQTQQQEEATQAANVAKYDSPVKAFGLGLARGGTFSLSDKFLTSDLAGPLKMKPEDLKGYEEVNPASSVAGEVGGIFTSALAIPGGGLVGGVGRLAGAAGMAAEKAAAKAIGEGIASKVVGAAIAGGIENEAYAFGQLQKEQAMGNPEARAENIMTGGTFMMGAAINIGFKAVGLTGKTLWEKLPSRDSTSKALRTKAQEYSFLSMDPTIEGVEKATAALKKQSGKREESMKIAQYGIDEKLTTSYKSPQEKVAFIEKGIKAAGDKIQEIKDEVERSIDYDAHDILDTLVDPRKLLSRFKSEFLSKITSRGRSTVYDATGERQKIEELADYLLGKQTDNALYYKSMDALVDNETNYRRIIGEVSDYLSPEKNLATVGVILGKSDQKKLSQLLSDLWEAHPLSDPHKMVLDGTERAEVAFLKRFEKNQKNLNALDGFVKKLQSDFKTSGKLKEIYDNLETDIFIKKVGDQADLIKKQERHSVVDPKYPLKKSDVDQIASWQQARPGDKIASVDKRGINALLKEVTPNPLEVARTSDDFYKTIERNLSVLDARVSALKSFNEEGRKLYPHGRINFKEIETEKALLGKKSYSGNPQEVSIMTEGLRYLTHIMKEESELALENTVKSVNSSGVMSPERIQEFMKAKTDFGKLSQLQEFYNKMDMHELTRKLMANSDYFSGGPVGIMASIGAGAMLPDFGQGIAGGMVAGALANRAWRKYGTTLMTNILDQTQRLVDVKNLNTNNVLRIGASIKNYIRDKDIPGAAKRVILNRIMDDQGFSDYKDTLTQLKTNPALLMEVVANVTEPYADISPNETLAMQQKLLQGLSLLHEELPKEYETGFLNKTYTSSAKSRSEYQKLLHLAIDPYALIDQMKEGTATAKHFELVKNLYPYFFEELQKAAFEEVTSSKKEISYQKRLMLAPLLGMPVNNYQAGQVLQPLLAKNKNEKPKVHDMKKTMLPGSYQTDISRVAS